MLSKKRLVLASLALHLLACRQGQRHTRAQLLALIQQILNEHKTHDAPLFPLAQASALLNDFTSNSALITEVEPDVYEFETVIWLQHLTGTALANQNTIAALKLTDTQVLDFLDKKAWDPEWEPVLRSWVGTAHDPLPILERLADATHDDLARHRLGTAGRCLFEVKPELKDHQAYQALSVQIPTVAFEQWKALAEEDMEELVVMSLRDMWIGNASVQTTLLRLLGKPRTNLRGVVQGTVQRVLPKAVQNALARFSKDRDADVRMQAVKVLGTLGLAMPIAVQQVLVWQLKDEQMMVRRDAVVALGTMGRAMPLVVQQALVERLMDKELSVRHNTVIMLGTLGSAMPVTVQQALVRQLPLDHNFLMSFDMKSLLELGDIMMPFLVQVYRQSVVEALGKLGTSMPEAVQQALRGCLTDINMDVRNAAAMALEAFGSAMPEVVQQTPVKLLRDEDQDARLRDEAVAMLETVGWAMPNAVQQALVAQLTDKDEEIRLSAVGTLGELGTSMPKVVQQALVVCLTDKDRDVRFSAVEVFGGMGMAIPDVVQQALVGCLTDKEDIVRVAAMEALGKLGSAMPEVVQRALVERLTNEDDIDVRRRVVSVLSSIQQLGQRYFWPRSRVSSYLVSDLCATAPLIDGCSQISNRPSLYITAA